MFDLQLADMGIMAKTVQVLAPLTARHVNTLTAHAVVMLVGANLTVLMVYRFNSVSNMKYYI